MAEKKYPRVLSDAGVKEMFGTFRYEKNGSSAIDILGTWEQDNITSVLIPQLVGIPTDGGNFSGRVRIHKKITEQLQRAFDEIGKQGMAKDFVQWGGSFVPRLMRSGKSLSRHSWGIAFDVNVPQNPYQQKPAAPGVRGNLHRVAPILESFGFAWGGRWTDPADGMHFEAMEVQDYKHQVADPDALLIIDNDWKQAIAITLKDGVSFASLTAMAKLTADTTVKTERLFPVVPYLQSQGYTVSWNAAQKKVYAVRTSYPQRAATEEAATEKK